LAHSRAGAHYFVSVLMGYEPKLPKVFFMPDPIAVGGDPVTMHFGSYYQKCALLVQKCANTNSCLTGILKRHMIVLQTSCLLPIVNI
jgi:hypothetical protein